MAMQQQWIYRYGLESFIQFLTSLFHRLRPPSSVLFVHLTRCVVVWVSAITAVGTRADPEIKVNKLCDSFDAEHVIECEAACA